MQRLRRSLKKVVTWPPVNAPLTTALRAVLPEGAREHPSVARYLPRAGVVEAELPTGDPLRMWSRGDDDIASTVFWRGWAGHEPETARQFLELAGSARVTLDVGAHVGYFTLLASIANPAGRVYAFEPLTRVRERLVRNVALNGLENVFCVPLALGAENGEAQFFSVEHGIPSSSSLSGQFMRSIVGGDTLASSAVEVTTVDSFVADHDLAGGVDLVKIDTENTEDDIFYGMAETLGRDRPSIVCEVLEPDTAGAIEAAIAPLGYEFFLLTDRGPVRCDHIHPHPRWRNFSFLPH